jgi:NADH:ubiquinone oxidoreductase subunit K
MIRIKVTLLHPSFFLHHFKINIFFIELSGAMQIVNLLKLLIDPENMLSAANVRFLF